jgi:hypothetical protein
MMAVLVQNRAADFLSQLGLIEFAVALATLA